ncbi:MAG: hypothetical protein CVV27_10865 [Candidatus Melainabacteria bacterium HGW-Melainabacteria-1]|nr:MAG: hypothetical protein CVV27_10865 [Candidatus Melainabacteria bacterium HGW-Melainabacteria-1]
MKFYYDSRSDILGIRFKPGKPEAAARRHEAMPGVIMDFDARGNLAQVEIQPVSRHHPGIAQLVSQLAQELLARSGELSQEALLAIEKTVRLGQDPIAGTAADYQPRFSFDAIANLLIVDFLRPVAGTELSPKRQIMQDVWAIFDAQGQLISMELSSAMQQFPDLQRFVEQGQELQAAQRFFR